jgi:hypothetical protein
MSHVEEYLKGLSTLEKSYLASAAEQAIVLMELEPESSQLRQVMTMLQPVLQAMARDGYSVVTVEPPRRPNFEGFKLKGVVR